MDEQQAQDEIRPAVRAYRVGMLISAAAALLVVLSAIGVQSGRILDAEGHGWGFSTLFGPDFGSGLNVQGWTVVTTPGQLTADGMSRYAQLLVTHAIVDTAFLLVYVALLLMVVRAACATHERWRLVGTVAVAALGAADLAENICALVTFAGELSPRAMAVPTTAKWALFGAVAVLLLLRLVTRRPPDPAAPGTGAVRRAVKAVIHQRFSYVPVVVILILSVPSGAAILEQLPDAQRAWTTDDGTGLRHAVAAVLSTSLLALFLVAIGRERTRYAQAHERTGGAVPAAPEAKPPTKENWTDQLGHLWAWTIVPAITVISLVVVVIGGQLSSILWVRFGIFVGLPLALVGGSVLCRFAWSRDKRWVGRYRPDEPPSFDEREAFAVGVAGTVAGIGALVVGGLGLLRAFTPLLVLPTSDYVGPSGSGHLLVAVGVLVGLGVLAVLGPWGLAILVTRRLGGPSRGRVRDRDTAVGRALKSLAARLRKSRLLVALWRNRPWLLLVAASLTFVALGVFPSLAAWIGLAATATLALGSLTGMVSGIGLVLQDRPTAEIFRLVGLRRTPLISLLVVNIVLVSVFGGGSTLHAVDPGPATATADLRPTLDQAFASWYARSAGCEVDAGSYAVRPMVMIAAEGGGIRAAYWTVKGLEAIQDHTCAAHSTLFSAGASGGSVGLTVARFSGTDGQPHGDEAVAAVTAMARSETLSRAADGTFVRDLVYGASGVPVPRFGEPDPFDWRDRARLIEQGWEGAGSWGARSFLPDGSATAESPATGDLVLNSTSVRNNCRVWVSQLRLPSNAGSETPSFDPERSCDKVPGVATRTIDLFTAYGPYVAGAATPTCLGQVSAVTAALLTARFPYVTPSGVVGPCPDRQVTGGTPTEPYWPKTQLVDGGYLENTGLATITDLSDQWLALVREHNQQALASGGTKPVLVVPIVVFLTNGERSVSQPQLGAPPTSELAVPVVTLLNGGSALSNNDALLGRARDAVDVRGFCPADPSSNVCRTLDARFPSRVVVIDRATQPEIGAPLGWTLSGESITALDHAMQVQLDATCRANAPQSATSSSRTTTTSREPSCRPGYATLGDFARYLSPG